MQILAFLLLCLVWGSSWVAIKFSLAGIPPFLGVALRFTIAVAVLYAVSRLQKISLRLPKRLWGIVMLGGLLNFTFDYGLVYWAEQHLSAGVTAIFFCSFPLFTGLFSAVAWRTESIRLSTGLGLAVGFLGVVMVFYEELLQTEFSPLVGRAAGAVIGAGAAAAFSAVLVKKYLQEIHPVSVSLNQMVWGVGGLCLIVLSSDELSRVDLSAESVLAVLYLGGVASALAFSLYYWLLQQTSAITVSLIIYLTPVVALLMDWGLRGERFSPRTVLGMLVIFAGIALTEGHRYRRFPARRSRAGR